jgi:hypothetical protein
MKNEIGGICSTYGVNGKFTQAFGQINLEGSCEHGNEFSGSVKVWKFLATRATISISRSTLLFVTSCQPDTTNRV